MIFTLPLFLSDWVEIIAISYLVYRFSSLLNSCHDASLLTVFYLYCGVISIAFIAQLHILVIALLASSPVMITLAIIFHQRTLQKNYILFKSPSSVNSTDHDWVSVLISFFITRMHNKQPVYCLIEHSDILEALIAPAVRLNAPLSKQILEVINESSRYDDHHHLWITSNGTIKAINSTLHRLSEPTTTHEQIHESDWHMYAFELSAVSDALIIRGDASSGTFEVIARQKCYRKLSSVELHAFIRSYQQYNRQSPEGFAHDFRAKNHRTQTRA